MHFGALILNNGRVHLVCSPLGRKLARTKQSRDDTCLKMVVRFKNCVAATDRVLCKRLLGNPQFETDMSQGSSHFLNHLIHSIQQAFFLVQNKIIPWTWNSWNFTITSISFRLNWIGFFERSKGRKLSSLWLVEIVIQCGKITYLS